MEGRQEWTTAEIDEVLEELKAITVPVNISIEGKQRVLNLAEVERILEPARLITLENCGCRQKIRGCDAPLDNCVCKDEQAEEALAERGAWKVTIEEAMDALRKGHEAGLVLLSFQTRANGRIEVICSCCACCCENLSAITRFGYNRDIIESSDMIAVHDSGLCDNCGICAERCHFKAWQMTDGEVKLDPEKCSGCGVCVSFCPSGALRFVKRESDRTLRRVPESH